MKTPEDPSSKQNVRCRGVAAAQQEEVVAKALAQVRGKGPAVEAPAAEGTGIAESKRKRAARSIPLLSEEERSELAKRFADAIPENELSVSLPLLPARPLASAPVPPFPERGPFGTGRPLAGS